MSKDNFDDHTLYNLTSGVENNNLVLAVIDKEGAIVTSIDDDYSATLTSNENDDWRPVTIGGGSVSAVDGKFTFNLFSITA